MRFKPAANAGVRALKVIEFGAGVKLCVQD